MSDTEKERTLEEKIRKIKEKTALPETRHEVSVLFIYFVKSHVFLNTPPLPHLAALLRLISRDSMFLVV